MTDLKKRKPLTFLVFVFFACLGLMIQAAEKPYQFPSAELEERFKVLTYELRCPKCQNQNIQDSDSMIAKDLRKEVARLLNEGKTDAEIMTHMVNRYGDYVRYRPEFSTKTLLLWLGPIALLIIAFIMFWQVWRAYSGKDQADTGLSEEEKNKLNAMIGQNQSEQKDK